MVSAEAAINSLTKWTAYAMSGLVIVRYARLPASCQYNVASFKGVPNVDENFGLIFIGDEATLWSVNSAHEMRTLACFACDRKQPCKLDVTSNPRK